MQTIYKIRIHSFVDLITNSSTEIYIQATEKTVELLKAMINNILLVGKSELTCDDLFEISTVGEGGDYYNTVTISVKCKNGDGQVAADILSDLTGLFNMSAEYNG